MILHTFMGLDGVLWNSRPSLREIIVHLEGRVNCLIDVDVVVHG
jgi:hypothetical protein